MRIMKTETKAVEPAGDDGRCGQCGHPKTADGCRTVPNGEWCVRPFGLWKLNTRPPTRDPLGPAEQAAVDEYTEQVAEAEKAAQEAAEVYEKASKAWAGAELKYKQAESSDENFVFGGRNGYMRRPGAPDVGKSRRAAAEAHEQLTEAEAQLTKARSKAAKMNAQFDQARRVARDKDKGLTKAD